MRRTVTIVERYHGIGNIDCLIHGSSFLALFMDFFLVCILSFAKDTVENGGNFIMGKLYHI